MLGDHIRALKAGKWVHGIDLGDQRVLHLVDQPGLAPGDRLRRVFKPEFTAGASRVELVVHRERTYPARAVVARAWSRFMDPSVVAMFRDSEAFAAWCKIGRLPEPAPVSGAAAKAPAAAPPRSAPPKPAAKAPAKRPARKAPSRKAAKRPAPKAPARPAQKAAGRKPAAKRPVKRPAPKASAKPARKAAGRKAAPARTRGRR
jgi:hypothetical protein